MIVISNIYFFFFTCLSDLNLHSNSQMWRKAKPFTAIISQNSQLLWIELGMMFRFGCLLKCMLSILSSEGENHTQVISFDKISLLLAYVQMIRDQFPSTLHWTLQFDTDLNDVDLHARSQLCEKVESSVFIFSQIYQLKLINFLVAIICCFVEAPIKFIVNNQYSREGILLR